MESPLNQVIARVASESSRLDALNECFIYLRAVSESALQSRRSDLFSVVSHIPAIVPNQQELDQICDCVRQFVETCFLHPNLEVAFVILAEIQGAKLLDYFRAKLRFHYEQGNLRVCYQLCLILSDLGEDVWRDEHGDFIGSRSYNDLATNLGVTKRYLARRSEKA